MPTYTLQAPNGKTYDIEGPEGATQEQVQAEILRRDPSAGTAPAAVESQEGEVRAPQSFTERVEARGRQGSVMPFTTEAVTSAWRALAPYLPLPAAASDAAKVADPGRYLVPQTPLQVGTTIGTLAAGPVLGPVSKVAATHPALARVLGGTVGGAVGGAIGEEGAAKGAAIGGLSTAASEGAGKLIGMARRAAPGAKAGIAREDTARVGRALANIPGGRRLKTAEDFGTEAAAAMTRRATEEAKHAAAQEAYRTAVAQSKTVAPSVARDAAALREQQALALQKIITKAAPQLDPAFPLGPAYGESHAASLRAAGAGGARRALSTAKEEVTRQLEEAVPDGILVPTLSERPVPVREALFALSEIGAGRPTQFSANPMDRNILGIAPRALYGKVLQEVRQALDDAQPGLGEVFTRGQQSFKEGLAVSKTLLEPDTNWLPTGELNLPGVATRVVKPRGRAALEGKLGAERYQQIAREIAEIPRAAAKPPAPVLPPPPQQAARPPADVVMETLFGSQGRYLQGHGTQINWPQVQRAVQAPAVRAELEAALGPEGYAQLKDVILRGAQSGADIPAAGSGRFGGPVVDWLSGREKGAGFTTSMLPRAFLPNMGARYVGRQPRELPPALQQILNLATQRTSTETAP